MKPLWGNLTIQFFARRYHPLKFRTSFLAQADVLNFSKSLQLRTNFFRTSKNVSQEDEAIAKYYKAKNYARILTEYSALTPNKKESMSLDSSIAVFEAFMKQNQSSSALRLLYMWYRWNQSPKEAANFLKKQNFQINNSHKRTIEELVHAKNEEYERSFSAWCYSLFKALELVPFPAIYVRYIGVLGADGSYEQVLRIYDDFKTNYPNYIPNIRTLNAVLSAYVHMDNFAMAKETLATIKELRIDLNEFTFRFVSLYFSNGLFDEAMNVFELMKKYNLVPSTPDFHQVLHLCLMEKKMENAIRVFDKMTNKTEETYILMINISRACKDEENEKKFWKGKEEYANSLSFSTENAKAKQEQLFTVFSKFWQDKYGSLPDFEITAASTGKSYTATIKDKLTGERVGSGYGDTGNRAIVFAMNEAYEKLTGNKLLQSDEPVPQTEELVPQSLVVEPEKPKPELPPERPKNVEAVNLEGAKGRNKDVFSSLFGIIASSKQTPQSPNDTTSSEKTTQPSKNTTSSKPTPQPSKDTTSSSKPSPQPSKDTAASSKSTPQPSKEAISIRIHGAASLQAEPSLPTPPSEVSKPVSNTTPKAKVVSQQPNPKQFSPAHRPLVKVNPHSFKPKPKDNRVPNKTTSLVLEELTSILDDVK